jgi:hypothetical protein
LKGLGIFVKLYENILAYIQSMTRRKQDGYILIMLLVVIAIGLTIYYMDIMWMSTDGRMLRNPQPQDQNQPWDKEALIRGPNQPAAPIPEDSNKPRITNTLNLAGPVEMKKELRGNVNLTITPEGSISGSWQCSYSYTHAAYEITAEFGGNTDAFHNASGDLSKLLLVAKGHFTQKATNLDSGEVTESEGLVYLNGWLNRDFTASGTLSTTTDKKWHADYIFSAATQGNEKH